MKKSLRTLLLIISLSSISAFGDDQDQPLTLEQRLEDLQAKPGYTINFTDVTALEVVKFLSKIGNLNFIYNEAELNFKITMLSEGETTLANVLSSFIQVLQIHGLHIIEDGPNLLIHQADSVTGIAPMVTDTTPFQGKPLPGTLTRVYDLTNANPEAAVAVIQQLISENGLVTRVQNTRKIIVTDVLSNVEKVSQLLAALNTPEPSLQLGTYKAQRANVEELTVVLRRLITPLSEGNPVIIAAQDESDHIFILSTPFLVNQSQSILQQLDAPGVKKRGNATIYQIQNQPYEGLKSALDAIAHDLKTAGEDPQLVDAIESMHYVAQTNAIVMSGTKKATDEVKNLLSNLDAPKAKTIGQSEFFIYRIKDAHVEQVEQSIDNLVTRLKKESVPDEELIHSLESMSYIPETHSLIFTGREQTLSRIKEILSDIDVKPEVSRKPLKEMPAKTQFFMYTPKTHDPESLLDSLEELGESLKKSGLADQNLINTLETAKYNKQSNIITFTGTKAAIDHVKTMLPTIDTHETAPGHSQYYVYKPQNMTGEQLLERLRSLSKSFKGAKLSNHDLLDTLNNARWVQATNSLIFTGTKTSIDEIKTLMPELDKVKDDDTNVYVYKVQNSSKKIMEQGLRALEENVQADTPLKRALESAQYLPSSNSFIFKGSPAALERLKDLLPSIDHPGHTTNVERNYYIYKLKQASGETVIKELRTMRSHMEDSDIDNKSLLDSLESARYIASTNSIYVTGSSKDLDEMKKIIASFDVPEKSGPTHNDYFLYTPNHASPEAFRSTLLAVAKEMQTAGMADEALITTVNNVKTVEATHSLLFTGSSETMEKIRNLVESLDQPGIELKQGGKKTFIVYKVKQAHPQQLISHLKSVASDLKESGAPEDKGLVQTIEKLRYIKETKSIVFTGTKEVLDRVISLLRKFDTAEHAKKEPAAPTAETYILYSPKHLSGEELIQVLKDFEQNLTASGVEDDEIASTIHNIKWMPRTHSLLVPGPQDATEKVKELLERFDIPDEKADHTLETIDDVSFLIYKLQYHPGNEIEKALQGIATELSKGPAKEKSKALIEAIHSVQWIQVTNSLVGTGPPQTLSRLRSLIQNIDTPLRQVFIEVLVIETEAQNSLDFGLKLGAQGTFRDRIGFGTFSEPPSQSGGPFSTFDNKLQNIDAKTPPSGKDIPSATGWDLGVIGNIITHKGKSYLALGSLIKALQQSRDGVISLNQKLITQDNKQSTIFVGSNVPYTGSIVTTQGASTQQNTNIEYRDIGVNLSITPNVGEDEMITLNINQDISEEDNQDASGIQPGQVTGIRTSKTTTQTRVTLPNKHFLAISGMIRNTTRRGKTGIPCLGSLPLLGAAFSENFRDKNSKNVIIFIRPHIINTFKEYKEITEEQEDVYRARSQAPEDFDEALELVKTPDDE